MRVVALVGNGSSIAYNPALSMDRLTAAILAELADTESDLPKVGDALSNLAKAASGGDAPERQRVFEELFGPLERLGWALEAFGELASIFGDTSSLRDALKETMKYGAELHRRAIGSALQVIADQSKANQTGLKSENVRAVAEWLNDARNGGTARVFTLNYDALLDAAFIQMDEEKVLSLSDMADARYEGEVSDGERTVTAMPIRDDAEWEKDVILYHLHGSLQWLSIDGHIWKVNDLQQLRDMGFWRRYARNETSWMPSVILSDQKTHAVQRDPFRWAYQRFESELRKADRVAIIGYGLGDYPVNRALARGLCDGVAPVVVIDRTDDPEGFRHRLVSDVVAHADEDDKDSLDENLHDRVTVLGSGIPDDLKGSSWPET